MLHEQSEALVLLASSSTVVVEDHLGYWNLANSVLGVRPVPLVELKIPCSRSVIHEVPPIRLALITVYRFVMCFPLSMSLSEHQLEPR